MNNNLYWEVKKTILNFDESFTVRDIVLTLKEKNIMNDDNKNRVMKIVDEVLELAIVEHIPFSDEFYILGSNYANKK